ncbi:hypothetical protein D3C77_481880 [compost metagenome]
MANTGQAHQRFMHFIATAWQRPGLCLHCSNGFGVKGTQVIAVLRLVPAPIKHRLGTPFLQRCIVEEGVGARIENR